MGRVFLVVMDSLGIGGAPDAKLFYNNGKPDTGANTLLHIAQACARGEANQGRAGPLYLPNLTSFGIGEALRLACGEEAPNLRCKNPKGLWGAATETSKGKDTPSGHWEMAGLPVNWDWHYFPKTQPCFPENLVKWVSVACQKPGILGNCHASGTKIIEELGQQHCETGMPICYTSGDSVFQIAAHEEYFGLTKLLDLCKNLAPKLHSMKVGRVIARPFLGNPQEGFTRTNNRKDFSHLPPKLVLTDRLQKAGHPTIAIGKIADIFSMAGIDKTLTGNDSLLMEHLKSQIQESDKGSFVFANFVEFDSLYGHRRDIAGYAKALEWFDSSLGTLIPALKKEDLLIITADHGNDPSWIGNDHTRERLPVICIGKQKGQLGLIKLSEVANLVLEHLGLQKISNPEFIHDRIQ